MKYTWEFFVKEMKKHDSCTQKNKIKQMCEKHNDTNKCKKVESFHEELKLLFNQIKNKYNFHRLNLGIGRRTYTPWISFEGWNDSQIYPCIIFDEKSKEPYLTLQIRRTDPLNIKTNKKLPINMIREVKKWFLSSNDLYKLTKIQEKIQLSNSMKIRSYTESSILDTKISNEKEINIFNKVCSEVFKIKDEVISIIYTEIIDNDTQAQKIFFKKAKDSSDFNKFIKKQINELYKEIIIFLFVKEENKNNKYIQMPIYKITKAAQIDEETRDYIYEATLHSLGTINPIENINLFMKNQKLKIIRNAKKISFDEIQDMIKKYSKTTHEDFRIPRTYSKFRRDRKIKSLAVRLANDHCQLCKNIAPFFNKNNTEAFLEGDHIIELREGGPDTIENVIALCPNCHRKKTYWDNDSGVKKIIENLKKRNKNLINKYKKE